VSLRQNKNPTPPFQRGKPYTPFGTSKREQIQSHDIKERLEVDQTNQENHVHVTYLSALLFVSSEADGSSMAGGSSYCLKRLSTSSSMYLFLISASARRLMCGCDGGWNGGDGSLKSVFEWIWAVNHGF
jgi:hypothetical protein